MRLFRAWASPYRAPQLEGAMAKLSALGFVFLVGSVIAGCGPNNRDNFGDDDGHGDGGGHGIDAPACATSIVKADKIPLDLYIMLDQSSSMSDAVNGGGTKW